MMALSASPPADGSLITRLPPVRGRYAVDVDLAAVTWFRAGGRAEVVFRPADAEDLARFLAEKPADVPVTVIGVGSNLLVRDGGVAGVVVRLVRSFATVSVEGTSLRCGAGALDSAVSETALRAGIAGLEFLSGVPGTIGGALRMNAGAYGRETRDVLVEAEVVTPAGEVRRLPAAALGLTYRHCALEEGVIFTAAHLQGEAGDPEKIAARVAEVKASRSETQPVRARTGGSTFKNPPGAKAWELIDRAGCRGLTLGRAQVSPLHCNFLINTGGATAAELEALGEEVRRRVREATGVDLEWEIRRIGRPASEDGHD